MAWTELRKSIRNIKSKIKERRWKDVNSNM